MIEQPVQIEVLPEDPEPIPPLIAEALEAFRNELPQLLQKYSRQWVAYHGRTRLRLSPSKNDLFDQLLREGHKRGELLVLGGLE